MASMKFSILTITLLLAIVNCQRSPYAGSRPIGYHDRLLPANQPSQPQIVSRFGDDNNAPQRPPSRGHKVVQSRPNFAPIIQSSPSLGNRIDLDSNNRVPQRLPYDAYNDRNLVDNYNRQPIDNRPFWLINAAHIERQRNQPQIGNFNPIAQRSSFLDG